MKNSTLRPREDHVAELTRGQRLPLDPIADIHLDVIFETLTRTWEDLLDERYQIVAEGSEAEINALLESRLNNLWRTDPLWSQLVTSVARGKESLSFDGVHLEKRPDLSIYLTGKHPSFPIVVECKIIDHASGKGVDLYCANGVARFIAGEYAWSNREAILIAYIRDDATVEQNLLPVLAAGTQRAPDPWQTNRLPMVAAGLRSVVSSSNHYRIFNYPSSVSMAAPGDIVLWHLWLKKCQCESPLVS
ncbi:hypothetical protein [Pseudomonas sp. 5Ae-yellow]|uniref:hypothetical protein n=1 Tax=Pseudomonas sp. 5Ae-yellow TaxID=2759848 RepID=UPI0015F700C9|nr:hypothetical protein [Pseudomonas sp. 5Ae-yellow]MBA6421826.1 hypothetical protein [Pseudomonas sp. 5Ae-yellow]